MTIERDDRDERQTRLEWMINEFQEAQRRRRQGMAGDRSLESQMEADRKAALAASVTSK